MRINSQQEFDALDLERRRCNITRHSKVVDSTTFEPMIIFQINGEEHVVPLCFMLKCSEEFLNSYVRSHYDITFIRPKVLDQLP